MRLVIEENRKGFVGRFQIELVSWEDTRFSYCFHIHTHLHQLARGMKHIC